MKRLKYTILVFFGVIFSNALPGQELSTQVNNIEKLTYVYKKIDNVEIKADLYRVRGEKKLEPVIIWIHGGALIWGSREDLPKEQMEFYLNNGYSVVSIDHRLAPATKLPEILSDITDAVSWVKENGENLLGANPNKVFLVGHSAGAYLSLLAGTTLPQPPNAIVSFYGYGDILKDFINKPDEHYNQMEKIEREEALKLVNDSIKTSATFGERFNYYVYLRQNGIWLSTVSGYYQGENLKELSLLCPIRNINQSFPPTLLIHGDKDTDVPFSEALALAEAFGKNKIDYQFIEMKGSGHVFDIFEGGFKNEEIMRTFEEVINFLKKYE